MSGHDVVYIVRPGDDNDELRYSLRSLRNVPHGTVWLVGYCPRWVRGVRHLPVEQSGLKYDNATANLREVARLGPRTFMLFNDDFYATAPVPGPPAPGHRGPLLELAERSGGGYAQMLRDTHRVLEDVFVVPEPLAYTLHVPLLMDRDGLRNVLDVRSDAPRLSWRSLYGNLELCGMGERQDDVKVHGPGGPAPGPWLSTSDTSFRYHQIGRYVRKLFPDPSPHER